MSKLELGEAFRLAPNAYMVVDRELRYVAANELYLKLTGSTLESLLGKNLFELFPNDPSDPNNPSREMLRRSFERVLRTGKPDALAVIAYRVPTEGHGDQDRYWSATHVPMLDEHGQVAFVLQNTADITELQRLKHAAATHSALEASVLERAELVQDANRILEEQRRHIEVLFQQAPGFMAFLRGPTHIFEMSNYAYAQLIGFREVVGRPVREALPEVVEQGFVQLLDNVYQTGTPFLGRGQRVELMQADGVPAEMFLDFVYQPIRGVDGEVLGIFVQGHDITDLKRAEAQLRASELAVRELNLGLERRVRERTAELEEVNRELESFSYSVSHDLRAPLRHITGFAQLLERRAGGSLDEGAREHLKTIHDAAQQGGRLVDDLLAFSRMGRQAMRKLPVELAELMRVLQRELAPEQAGRDVRWTFGELPQVVADPGLLRLALRNLLENALKYTRSRATATISVTAVQREDEVEVQIADNGVGFDMQYADKLFGVFQRLHTAEQFEGTGIGLANVRRIINRHGGRVWADAKLEHGASFTFTLPT
ncbi:MAG TPA: ATP-binding protein [Polyangiales bacterium]|nr:ATP-binding protein [Polyangiales bacterium]